MFRTLAITALSLGVLAGCAFDGGGVRGLDGPSQSRRKPIDIRGQVGATLRQFPVAVVIDVDADLATKANPDGSDLLFTGADGETILPFEIERFDPATGALAAWVTVPEIDEFEGDRVFLYYGAADAISQADAFATWGDLFTGVWHLSVDDGAALDSTRRGNHGLSPSSPTTPQSTDGVAGGALEFSAVRADMVTVTEPNDDSLDFGSDSYSLSLWVEVDQSVGPRDTPWSKGANNPSEDGYSVQLGSDEWTASVSSQGTLHSATFGDESEFLGEWTHLAMVVDRDARRLRSYTNGEMLDEVDIGFMGPIENTLDATLGGPPSLFNGRVDEIRVYGAALSDEWIRGEYDNLSAPSVFARVGVEERR